MFTPAQKRRIARELRETPEEWNVLSNGEIIATAPNHATASEWRKHYQEESPGEKFTLARAK